MRLLFFRTGISLPVAQRIAADPQTNLGHPVTLGTAFKGVTPFALTAIVVVVLLIVFPEIGTWLPGASAQG